MTDAHWFAPCGLDCAVCDIYLAAQRPEAALRLAEQWHGWNPDAKPEWFRCQGCCGDRVTLVSSQLRNGAE